MPAVSPFRIGSHAQSSTAPYVARARVRTGFDETLYASVFYHLSKRTELYLAGDYMKPHGGYKVASTLGSNNRLELTAGIRTRF
ncbi:porin [Burkholderia multivorans]|nr:porin [Burkholderia multivorans]